MIAYRIEWTCQSLSGVQAHLAESEATTKARVIQLVARRLGVPTVLVTASVNWKHTWAPGENYLKDGRKQAVNA